MSEMLKKLIAELEAEGLLIFVFEKNDRLNLLSIGSAFDGQLDLDSVAAGAKKALETLITIAGMMQPSTITPVSKESN